MNKKNTNKLYRDFPKLYKGRTKNMRESLMLFGFSCGDGWFKIIYDLSRILENYINEHPETELEAVQVKEKFGTLRFYTNGGDDYTERLISEVCTLSGTICEDCGEPAQLNRHGGWFATLCKLCAFKRGYDKVSEPEEEDVVKGTEEERPSPIGANVMCQKCKWVHFVNIDEEYKDYGYKCFRCGLEGKENFVEPKEEDIPYGSTVQQVNTVKPTK